MRELDRIATSKKQGGEEVVNDHAMVGPTISRHQSRVSVRSKVEAAKGLWSWQRV